MPNHLAQETSPYLLQHKDNPVDWYPWGQEALDKAKRESRPIFLSIGYAACHWCHVMAHESFEDPAIAKVLNENFVSIKVDREERPDIDGIYMNAVQAINGSGGWPMSVFLLSDGRPFFGGTYFPDKPRFGMPSFLEILSRVVAAYHNHIDELESDASNLTKAINRTSQLNIAKSDSISAASLEMAFQQIALQFDPADGGFSSAPKFPPSMTLELLLRLYRHYGWKQALEMVTKTLDKMAYGGIYDQLGGGFHRYSTDSKWLVPHFEKMLYDNALLIKAYLYGYQVTGSGLYRRVVEETVDYVRREMTAVEGGFYSSQDADSEGHEGKFFTWEDSQLRQLLSTFPAQELVLDYWGVSDGPNFEDKSILWVPSQPEEVAGRHSISLVALAQHVTEARRLLFEAREIRIRPQTDTKVIAAWNGLMISALAQAARVLDRDEFRVMAVDAAKFLLEKVIVDGRLKRTFKDNQARLNGYLEDYANVIDALIEVYSTTFESRWLTSAITLAHSMVDLFWDDEVGFYDTPKDHEKLVIRPQELMDNATPSGTSAAVGVLLKLSLFNGEDTWKDIADSVLVNLSQAYSAYPSAFSYVACQADFVLSRPHEIALVGDLNSLEMSSMLNVIFKPFRPNQIVAHRDQSVPDDGSLIPLLRNKTAISGKATAYVCHNYTCELPVNSPEALSVQLDATLPG